MQNTVLKISNKMAEINIIKKRQTLVDFVTQHTGGSADELFKTALDNGISPTDDIQPGTALVTTVVKQDVVDLFANKDSGSAPIDIISNVDVNEIVQGGIGYMKIGSSFIVS
jgi:hypothetical protein